MKLNILNKIAFTFILIMIIPILTAGIYLNRLVEKNRDESIRERLLYGKNYVQNIIKTNEAKNKAKSIKIAGDRRLWNYLDLYTTSPGQDQISTQQSAKVELLQMMAEEEISILRIYDTHLTELFDISHPFIAKRFHATDRQLLQSGFSGISTRGIFTPQGMVIYSCSPVREYYKGTVATGKITNILVQGRLIPKSAFENIKEMSGQEFSLTQVDGDGEATNILTTFHDAYGNNLTGYKIREAGYIEAFNSLTADPNQILFRIVRKNDKTYRAISFSMKIDASNLYIGTVYQETDNYRYGIEQFSMFALLGIIFCSIFLASIIIARSIVTPVNRLVKGINALSENIEDQQALTKLDIQTGDEFHTLSNAFNAMAEKLQSSFSEIKELKDYLSNIIDSISSILIAVDENGRVTLWNKAAEKYFHITADEATGKLLLDVTTLFKELPTSIKESVRLKTAYGYNREYLDNGRMIYQHVSVFPLHSDKIIGLVIRVDDITESESKNRLLQQAQKMDSIGTLAGGIAHDFNNLLTAILGYTELARHQAQEDLVQIAHLDKVILAGNRAKELVSKILAFSRQDESVQKPLHPKYIIKEAVKLLRSSIPVTITIKPVIDDACGPIKADATQIHQIIMNLCTNAYQAMEEHGGTLLIGLEKAKLTKTDLENEPSLSPGPYVKFTVQDNGNGIDPVIQKHIFEPFFTTKRVGQGTGMGLAVVHGIVKNHGGFIRMESTLGEGTTFSVFFPEIQDAIQECEEPSLPVSKGNERILFVDDEELLADLGKQLLEQLGYSVTAVTDSMKALEIIKSNPEMFDLIITDQTMPEMTGAAMAKEILAMYPEMPIILCTGYSNIITKEQALAMGIRDFVMKPVVKNDIAPLIRKIFDENTTES